MNKPDYIKLMNEIKAERAKTEVPFNVKAAEFKDKTGKILLVSFIALSTVIAAGEVMKHNARRSS